MESFTVLLFMYCSETKSFLEHNFRYLHIIIMNFKIRLQSLVLFGYKVSSTLHLPPHRQRQQSQLQPLRSPSPEQPDPP